MKIAFKIFKFFAILIFVLFLILFAASRLMQDKVSAVILRSLNQNISTKLQVKTFSLSFLRKFPKASLELRDVLVHSSPDFNSAAFAGINTDTLLSARNVSVEFRITDILRGIYNIERIRAKNGKVKFFTDSEGRVNYDISVKSNKPASDDFTINLDKVFLTDIKSYYNNLATKIIIYGIINKGTLKSRIHGNNIGFNAGGELQLDSIQLYKTMLNKRIVSDIDINLQKSKSGIKFNKGKMHVDNYDFGLDGFISADNIYDLNITGRNVDISKIRNYLPDDFLRAISACNLTGILAIDSKIKGKMTRTFNPHIEINWGLKNGRISYGKSRLSINNISFTGHYTNGSGNRPVTNSITLSDINASLGTAGYKGSFSVSDFNNPVADLHITGRVIPSEISEFFALDTISVAAGSADIDLTLSGWPDFERKFGLSQTADLKTQGTIIFNSFCIGLKNSNFLVNKMNGHLLLSGTMVAKDLTLSYLGQSISVNGEFKNLLRWLDGRPDPLIVNADVSFDRLIPGAFIKETPSSEKSSVKRKAFNLPEDLILDINFKIDSLKYKTFSSSKISGTLSYKPKLLTFKSFNMKALKGTISGNGFVLQNNNRSVLSKGIFNVTNVDVNKAFTAFRNFGQDFLVAENIAGSLSGSFSLLLPLDSLLHPQIKSLTAEGKFILANGGLINFEPVKQLSSFIELSELENISFQQMENDFFIRNNYLYIPQMEVRSSAVDLSVNGKHSLDNDYEYHVKVLLSEILSKKRKKNKKTVTEFGTVEDDGLGRTSMLLKVVNKGEDVKVSYDMKAAANELRNNIKTEKKTLKTILNQEYGWFKKDSSEMKKPEEKKSRFKVTWEDK